MTDGLRPVAGNPWAHRAAVARHVGPNAISLASVAANQSFLPSGNVFANVNAITQGGWWTYETTNISNGETTTFIDIPGFIDVFDEFLSNDKGSTYILFPQTSILNPPIVGV